jgi:hypothetical protein
MKQTKPQTVEQFDRLADSVLLPLNDAGAVLGGRSRASLYRDAKAGRLTLRKVGRSTFVKAGDLRKLIDAA